MKKVLFTLVLGICASSVLRAQSGTTGSLSWSISDGTLTISGQGRMKDFDNPSVRTWNKHKNAISNVVIEDGVTSIGNNAFADVSLMRSITIPNSVTSIGNSAFYRCTYLTSIAIPNSVTEIGDDAFRSCLSLRSITIPNGVTEIGKRAFASCSDLTSITIPNGVTSIGESAFERCFKLMSITIPNSVTSIGMSAFEKCFDLMSITIPNSVTSIGNGAFRECTSLISVSGPFSLAQLKSLRELNPSQPGVPQTGSATHPQQAAGGNTSARNAPSSPQDVLAMAFKNHYFWARLGASEFVIDIRSTGIDSQNRFFMWGPLVSYYNGVSVGVWRVKFDCPSEELNINNEWVTLLEHEIFNGPSLAIKLQLEQNDTGHRLTARLFINGVERALVIR